MFFITRRKKICTIILEKQTYYPQDVKIMPHKNNSSENNGNLNKKPVPFSFDIKNNNDDIAVTSNNKEEEENLIQLWTEETTIKNKMVKVREIV